MDSESNKRRGFIKAGLAVPLFGVMPWTASLANAHPHGDFLVPQDIHEELIKLYGNGANTIANTDKLELAVPPIAENGAVVPVRVKGEKGHFSSLAIFVARNPKPLASRFTLHEGTDLGIAVRLKVGKTSDIYVVANTDKGLVGVKRLVKVTIGCGGV